MRLIDADKIIDWLWGEPKYYDVRNDRTNTIDYIKNQPTADVLPVVHGFWIDINNYGIKERKCSNCGKKDNPKTAIKGHYCWNCGARMDGENNDT